MTEDRLIELINNEIDGSNSASDHEALMQYVSSNRDAATLYHDLLRTARSLENVEQVSPPSYLKKHILNSIAASQARPVRGSRWQSTWGEVFRSRPTARYITVFASGLCVGLLFLVLVTSWQRGSEPDASTVSGTMAFFTDLHGFPALESIPLEGEGVTGFFKMYRGDGNVFVQIEVHSLDNLSVELNSDPEEFRFGGIRRLPGAEGEVNVTQGKVTLSGARSEQAVVAFSGRDLLKGTLEGRVYRGNILAHHVILRVK